MSLQVRKVVSYVEKTLIEGGRAAERPLVMIIAAAVIRNPWAGLPFQQDLRPKILSTMWPGTRVVTHAFDMGDWQPDQKDSVTGRQIYLWIVPARIGGTWTIKSADTTFTLEIKQKYQEITGSASIDGQSVPLRDTLLNGAEFGFAVDIKGLPYRFQGHVIGDRIEGLRNEWRGTRNGG